MYQACLAGKLVGPISGRALASIWLFMSVKAGLFGSPGPHHLKAMVDKAAARQTRQEEVGYLRFCFFFWGVLSAETEALRSDDATVIHPRCELPNYLS